jgi:hypothetical protein
MKHLKLVPIAGMLMASSAFAAAPASDIVIYAAGASAQLNSISAIFTSLCEANQPGVTNGNQIQFYQGYATIATNTAGVSTASSSATTSSSNLRAYRCKLKSVGGTTGAVDGKTVTFVFNRRLCEWCTVRGTSANQNVFEF